MQLQNKTKNIRSQCQLVLFPWKENTVSSTLSIRALSQVDSLDISASLLGCSFSKSRTQAAGAFTFSLANDRDWRNIIKPGMWCLLYMDNEGTLDIKRGSSVSLPSIDPGALKKFKKKLRGICYIERAALDAAVGVNGELEVTYQVTGRDFGVVYEEANIWLNSFNSESLFFFSVVEQVIKLAKRPEDVTTIDELMKLGHKILYNPADIPGFKSTLNLPEVLPQWIMPQGLITALELKLNKQPSLYGNISGIIKENDKFFFGTSSMISPTENPLIYLQGNAWTMFKAMSVEPFHELFPETDDDGHPRLIFRPIPWGLSDKGYKRLSKNIISYRELADKTSVTPEAVDVISMNLGLDNHSRWNHFFITISGDTNHMTTGGLTTDGRAIVNIATKRRYPLAQTNSILRHGLRLMHVDVNSFIELTLSDKRNGVLLAEFSDVLFDYWNNAVFFESGTVSIIGNNKVKVGKTILFDENTPYIGNKVFYIEGYMDEFTVDPTTGATLWTQNLQLTRGIDKNKLNQLTNFDDAKSSLDIRGEFTPSGA